MMITFIGVPLLLIGLVLLAIGSLEAMLTATLLCALLGGAAAINMPALGGSSIPPLQFMLPFLIMRILLPGSGHVARVGPAVQANVALLCFTAYGIVAAMAAPRIFANAMLVPPLRFRGFTGLYDVVPLVPTSQNITTSVYLLGTLALAIATYVACMQRAAGRTLVRAAVIIAVLHAATGLLGLVGFDAVLNIFRNGSYAQLSQSYGGFIRMNGLFPEASAYAGFAFHWFVFLFECWYGGVQRRLTGAAALLLAAILVFSTSSSAYVSLLGYAVLFCLRLLLMPQAVRLPRMIVIGAMLLAGAVAIGAAILLVPAVARGFGDMLSHMTVEKGTSTSGLQRLFWAKKGLEAFRVSYGLGIGLGSFRSSSLLTAILGSAGVIGLVSFIFYVARVFMPLRASTYLSATDERSATGVAASWAVLVGLIPASVASPSADPGLLFAIFSGAALALRRPPAAASSTVAAPGERGYAS